MTASPSPLGFVRVAVPVVGVLVIAFLFLWLLPRGSSPDSPSSATLEAEPEITTIQAPLNPPFTPEPLTRPDVGLADRFVLTGRVLKRLDDAPIEGALIVARERGLRYDMGSRWKPTNIAQTTSDARGGFEFRRLPVARERVNLVVTKPGLVSYEGFSYVRDRGHERVIRLGPGVVITGEVVFEDGTPVTGGNVEIHDQVSPALGWMLQENPRARFYTPGSRAQPLDRNGHFTITVDSATVALDVQGDTLAPAFSRILFPRPDEKNHVVIRVARGKSLVGTVRTPDGSPISGAWIRVMPQIREIEPDCFFTSYRDTAQARSRSDGTFVVAGLSDRYQDLLVEHDEYLSFCAREPRATETALHLELQPAQWITGRLVSEKGDPVPAETFAGLTDGSGRQLGLEIRAGGEFRSGPFGIETTRATLKVQAFLGTELEWPASPGETQLGDVTLPAGRSIEVTVKDAEGFPIAGATVRVLQKDGGRRRLETWFTTGLEGKGRSSGLAGPQVEIQVTKTGFALWAELRTIDEVTDAPLVVVATPDRCATLRGRVVDEDGNAVFGASLRGHYEETDPRGSGYEVVISENTGPSGQFANRDVRPGTRILLDLAYRGLSSPQLELDALHPGEDRDLGTLTLNPGFSMAGEVRTTAGKGVVGALVSATRKENLNHYGASGDQPGSWAETDIGGTFKVRRLSPGKYEVRVRATGYSTPAPRIIEVTSDFTGIAFTVEAGRIWEGVVVDDRDAPVAAATVTVQTGRGGYENPSDRTDAEGRFQVLVSPKDALDVSIGHDDHRTKNLSFSSADELPDRIQLESGARLKIRLNAPEGTPLPSYVGIHLNGHQESHSGLPSKVENGVASASGLPAGDFQVQVEARGFPTTEWQAVELRDRETAEIDVTLEKPGEPVVILVLDDQGEPLAGAEVAIYQVEGHSLDGRGRGATDVRGRFLTNQLGAHVAISVMAPDHAPTWLENAIDQVVGQDLTVQLEPESAFVVTVLAVGEPVDGVIVQAQPATRGRPSLRDLILMRRDRTPTRNGIVRLGGLSAGDYLLSASRENTQLGHQNESIRVGEAKAVVFELSAPIPIEGMVRRNGEPVSGGVLQIQRDSFRSQAVVNPDGRFSTELNGGAGEYRFSYHPDSARGRIAWVTSRNVEAATQMNLDYTVGRVSGRVRDPARRPVANAKGIFLGETIREFRTDAEGRFTLDDISPGVYSWRLQTPPPGTFAPMRTIEIQGSPEIDYDLEEAIELRVSVDNGDPERSFSVLLLGAAGRFQRLGKNPAGMFIWPVTARTGFVRARGFAPAFFTVDDPQDPSPVTVTLQPGARLEVRIRNEAGGSVGDHPFAVTPLDQNATTPKAYQTQRTNRGGGCIVVLKPGRYRISVSLPSGNNYEKDVTLLADETKDITLP